MRHSRAVHDEALAAAADLLVERIERAGACGHWVWRGVDRPLELSRGLGRILGLAESPLEISQEEFLAIAHPEQRDLVARALERGLRGRRGWRLPHRMRRPDGEERCLETEASFVADPPRLEGVVADVTERMEAQRRLREVAFHDPFTGVASRQAVLARMLRGMDAAEGERKMGVALLDLDQFERLTELHGRERTQAVLIAAAERFAAELRAAAPCTGTRELARVGSAEFAVVLYDVDGSADVVRMAQRLRESLARPFHVGDREITVAVNAGTALFPDDAGDPESLLEHAAIAMRSSRGSGRVGVFSPEMREYAERRANVESALPGALARGEFWIALQPVVSAATGEVFGAEALLRWSSPALGVVGPDEFVPTAERTGEIHEIGRFVLDAACREAMRWRAAGHLRLAIGVNVSARELEQQRLTDDVPRALERYHLEPSALHLEITETALIRKHAVASENVRRLKRLGVRFSLDDFGTGYSTLSHLARFEMDVVKIDKSFVRAMPDDPHLRAVVGAVIGLAHRLGARVIAEGVETQAQEQALREEGCELLQGYRYARPMPPDAFLAWLDAREADPARRVASERHGGAA